MYIDTQIYTGRPAGQITAAENEICDLLDILKIAYIRVDHEHADTMEDCRLIENTIGARICKNLFLCNRQQTDYYLLMMPGDKIFKTKYLSAALGCSRLSFAPADAMLEYLHTTPGSASGLELLFDTGLKVTAVMDSDLLKDEFICAHPGLSVSTLKFTTKDFLSILDSIKHSPVIVELPTE